MSTKPEPHERNRKISKSDGGDYNNPSITVEDEPVVKNVIAEVRRGGKNCAICKHMRWFNYGKFPISNKCVHHVHDGRYTNTEPYFVCGQHKHIFFKEEKDKYIIEFNGHRKILDK